VTAEDDFDRLPIAAVLRINARCDEFETEWKAGQQPTIDAFLGDAAGLERDVLARQLKQIEFDYHGVPVAEFLQRLQVEQLPVPAVTATSAATLAEELVASGTLTPYQARTLLSLHPHPLALGDYLILDHIASGGMGTVYRALHRRMKREVALKVVTGNADHGASRHEWFQREVETAARLHHPNVVTAYDAGEARGTAYLVSEYVPGTDLQRYVAERGPLSVAEAVRATRDAALGLEYAHQAGVIHRDVKPSNLVRTPSGLVRVLDVGLARLTRQDSGEDRAIVGTPGYMAPEQADDPTRVDGRSDVYGLGATLYFVLTGRAMFEGHTAEERLAAQREGNAPSVRKVRPEVSVSLERLLLRMTARDPSDRPGSMSELLASLDRLSARRRYLVPIGLAACVAFVGVSLFPSPDRASPIPQPDSLELPARPELLAVPFDAAAYQSQWASALGGRVQIEPLPGLTARLIPPGRFVMGTPSDIVRQQYASEPEAEREARVAAEVPREVTIESPFYLGTTEVTVGQFRTFVESSRPAYLTLAERPSGIGYSLGPDHVWRMLPGGSWRFAGEQPVGDEYPVCNLGRDDCSDFCSGLTRRLGGRYECRLPTEAEWEYACRAGNAGLWSCGSDARELPPLAWYAGTVEADDARFRPVARKAANAFGLFDLHGNLEEWCTATPPGVGAVVRGGNVRGGSFAVRSAGRESSPPTAPRGGFRVVLVPSGK